MDQEFKAKWLAALRSGKYKQVKGRLYDGEGYCCLGIACVVAGIEPEIELAVFLPKSLAEKLDIRGNGMFSNETLMLKDFKPESFNQQSMVGRSLASLNDTLDFTFAEIADMIEHPDTEFKPYSSLEYDI